MISTVKAVTCTPASVSLVNVGNGSCAGIASLSVTSSQSLSKVDWYQGNTFIMTSFPQAVTAGTTIAGGTSGSGANQLTTPYGVFADAAGAVYISDNGNHRIQKWAAGATSGTTVAGGNGQGSGANQLDTPLGIFVDATGAVYIADRNNHRVQKWAAGATSGTTVAGGNGQGNGANQLYEPSGVFVDAAGSIYIVDKYNHRVQKWASGATSGTTVAGGNGKGGAANQLDTPFSVYVNAAGDLYIADVLNNRVQKWTAGATTGTTVAGGNGQGSGANQLNRPFGVYVDAAGAIYVCEQDNYRVQKWSAGATSGTTVAGGNGWGNKASQLADPNAVFVDPAGAIYIADNSNHRVQKWVGASSLVYNPATTGTYTVRVTGTNGCTAASNSVTVASPAVSVTATSGLATCKGNSATLTASGADTYIWSTGATAASIIVNPQSTTAFQVTGLKGQCVATSVATVTVNPSVTATISGVQTIYQGSSASLTASGGDGFKWSGGETTPGITVSPTSTSAFQVTVTNTATGCASVASYTVLVRTPLCNAPVYVTPGGNGTADGSSWSNALPGSLFPQALATACTGTTFLVGSGLYKPTTSLTDRTASFTIASGVEVYGGYTVDVSNGTAVRGNVNPVTGMPASTTFSGDIDGNNANNSLHVVQFKNAGSNTRLDGIVITGGNATSGSGSSAMGGGIYNDGTGGSSNPVLTNLLISGNQASGNGGGIYNDGGSLLLTDVLVSQNTAVSHGGGIYSKAGSVGLTNTHLQQNMAVNGQGGGAYSTETSLSMTNGVVSQNQSGQQGGGLLVNTERALLTGVRISQNSATGTSSGGGGIASTSANTGIDLQSCTIAQNSSGNAGVGILTEGDNASFTASNTLFTGNISSTTTNSHGGGGFCSTGANTVSIFTSSTFTDNRNSMGGGISAEASSTLSVVNSLFRGNVATGNISYTGGGAIFSRTDAFSVTGTQFSQNTALGTSTYEYDMRGGGAIFLYAINALQTASIQSSTFTQNCAVNGLAGALVSQGIPLLINNCDFAENRAAGVGGAIRVDNANLLLTNASLTSNSASGGGGAHLNGSNSIMNNVRIADNVAENKNGGGVLLISSTLKSENCRIINNMASGSGQGGGMYSTNGSSYTIIRNSIAGNQSDLGGAFYTLNGSAGLIINSAIYNNRASVAGALYLTFGSSHKLVNVTLSGNQAATAGNVFLGNNGSGITVENSILWQNGTPANNFSVLSGGSTKLTNCIIDPASTTFVDGGNNKTSDPLFTDAGTGDYTLLPCSPAINAGDNTLYSAVNGPATDIAGNARPTDTTVDIGAYEFQGIPTSLTLTAVAAQTLACTGGVVTLTSSLSGATSPVAYNWTASAGVTLPASATDAGLSATLTAAGEQTFTVSVTDAGGCKSQTVVSLSVVEDVSITTQPAVTSAICAGGDVTVPVTLSGSVGSHQWYKNGSPVMSQTATTLSLSSVTANDAGDYQLVIETTGCGSLTTSTFSLTVNELVAIAGEPVASTAACVGSSISIPVSIKGGGVVYQWYLNGSPVTSQTTTTLNIPAVATTDQGTYSLVATGGCNSVTSTAAVLTVNPLPVVTINPSFTTINVGQSVTLTASGANSYTWNTAATGNTVWLSPVETTAYSVTGLDNNGCTGTATASVSVACGAVIQSDAISVTQTAVLDADNCSVSLKGYGYGTDYIITGPEGYVFSGVYRKAGYYTLEAREVKLPGTYTFTVLYSDACGERSRDSMTYVVTGTACK